LPYPAGAATSTTGVVVVVRSRFTRPTRDTLPSATCGTRTFESNYLALVELDEPALPWLFTPASASAGRLRPWLCLVVVREQPGVQLVAPTRGSLPVLTIGAPALPEEELPDLDESWAWAHAQLATDASMTDAPPPNWRSARNLQYG